MHGGLQIKIVESKQDMRNFIQLPWELYKGDPCWVPPLLMDMHNTLNPRKNPLLSLGPHRFFIAYRQEKPVGRLGVGIDQRLNEVKGEALSYLTLFESIDDYTVAKTLFTAGEHFLREQGAKVVTGPQSPSNGDDYRGLLVKGFDSAPILLNSYNPPYYQSFFERYGFEKDFDRNAYYYDISGGPSDRLTKGVGLIQKRYGYNLTPINLKKIQEEIAVIKHIIDLSMPDWPDMIPPSTAEITAEVNKLKQLAIPDLVLIAKTYGGEPVGFSVTLPDYNEVLPRLNGHLFPFGIFKFLWYKRHIKGLRFFVIFVTPQYRKKGVAACLYHQTMVNALRRGFTHGEGSTIHEFNIQMNLDASKAGGDLYKIYRIYRKDL